MTSKDRSKGQPGIADKAAIGAANVYSSLQFASVNESRENLFSAGLNGGANTPLPPKFQF